MILRYGLSIALVLSASGGYAESFPEIFNSEDTTALPMPAEKAARSMMLPDGFEATVFAAEPDVQNPIAMAWDDRGRMWVAENYTYAERSQRFDLSLRDRVLIFDDTDGDGRADTRKVFTDQVQMLTSVETGRGGVWLMCPPQLLFIADADGDDVPDGPAQVVLDGFDVAQDNYHNFANGLRWGPDGWLYGRCGHSCPGRIGLPGTPDSERVPLDGGIWRYHPERKIAEALCHGTTNPWGHDWDENGELFFINTVIGHLWHLTPGAHFKESFGESLNPYVYERMDMIADHYHFDTNSSWTKSRDGAANDYGGGHAHVGMLIYHGDALPSRYDGQLMTINMHGMRVNVESLHRTPTGYVGKHQPDFLLSKDPFFRGTELSVGPDRHVYMLDWSDTGECHEQTGVHRESGRIYRISHGNASDEPFAKPLCILGDGPLQRMWRDYRAGGMTAEQLRVWAAHEDEHVRVWAVRLLTDFWPLDRVTGPASHARYPQDDATFQLLVAMAHEDPSGLVARTLASTLQRLPVDRRAELATALTSRPQWGDSDDLSLLVWYGVSPLTKTFPEQLVALARRCQWPRLHGTIARALATEHAQGGGHLDRLLVAAAEFPDSSRGEILDGMASAFRGMRQVRKCEHWPAFATAAKTDDRAAIIQELDILFGDGRAIEEVKAIVLDDKAELAARKKALETLIDARADGLKQICMDLLDVRVINATALKGLNLFDEPDVNRLIVLKYRTFRPEDRAGVIEMLVSRPSSAKVLLATIESGRSPIKSQDITAPHARQIRSLGDDELNEQLKRVWGDLRDSSEEKRQAISDWKQRLDRKTLAAGDLSAGRSLFSKTCAGCHVLFGEGSKVAPDLTGAQRSSLEYLLENILDPSAVVGKDYRMSTLLTTDGRILNGLVVSRDDNKVVLRTATEELAIPTSDIEGIKQTSLSAMPDGLLHGLSDSQVRDLVAYLMSPSQVPAR